MNLGFLIVLNNKLLNSTTSGYLDWFYRAYMVNFIIRTGMNTDWNVFH